MTRKTSPKPADIVTLADLSPQRRVTGGSRVRVFGADAPASTKDTRTAHKTRDLEPKSSRPVKGGRLSANDNLTLLRAKQTVR
jgi:hypothetical protein